MGTGEFTAGGLPCDGLASHPGGSRNTPSCFMQQRPEIRAGPYEPVGSNAGITYQGVTFKEKLQNVSATIPLMSPCIPCKI